MSQKQTPLFVQRRTYRSRRMADAARMLPILGAILFFLPLLWKDGEGGARTAGVMVYLFLVWVLLAMLAGILSYFLKSEENSADSEATSGGEL